MPPEPRIACPNCGCWWFRTLNPGAVSKFWRRQCKHCGHEWYKDRSAMVDIVRIGEPE